MLVLLLLLQFMAPAPLERPQRPNATLTPGATRAITVAQMCATPNYTDTIRKVTVAMKREVFHRYGIPMSGAYEVDHLIPLVLGGDNAIENLWPQHYTSAPCNARVKDALEINLRRRVCWGGMKLEDAQQALRLDWVLAYRTYLPGKTSCGR